MLPRPTVTVQCSAVHVRYTSRAGERVQGKVGHELIPLLSGDRVC